MRIAPTLLLITITILLFYFARIENITCFIADDVCPEEIQNQLSALKGSSFFFTNSIEAASQLIVEAPIYSVEHIQKEFPNKITVFLSRENSHYKLSIYQQDSSEEYYFGASGIALPSKDVSTQLVVNWRARDIPIENEKINSEIHSKLSAVANELRNAEIESATLEWISDSEILLEIKSEPPFIFDAETLQTQVQKIDTILSAREVDEFESQIKEIDMRFDLPVLRTVE